MVKLCALLPLLFVLWTEMAVAVPLTYLDANFATETVAQDFSGIPINLLAAKSTGVVWGGYEAGDAIIEVNSGEFNYYAFPSPGIGAVEVSADDTLFVGTYYTGSSASAKIYTVDAGGSPSEWVTLPANANRVLNMAVSPTNGDVLVSAEEGSTQRLIKYDSNGVLQWNVLSPQTGQFPVAYNTSGQAIASDLEKFYAIDSSDGSASLISAVGPSEYVGLGVGFVNDMEFSSAENLFISARTGNIASIHRINITTGQTDQLAEWEFVIPPLDRWMDYQDGLGLYINDFDAGELSESNLLSFALSTPTAGVLLLQGDFNGEFAGFSSAADFVPEPSSAWLLLGLLTWKRKKLGLRRSPPSAR